MRLYGEPEQQFRAAPSGLALGTTSVSLGVITTQLAILLLAIADLLLGIRGGLQSPLTIHAPFAGAWTTTLRTSPPLAKSYGFAPPAIALGSIAFAFILIWFWPTAQQIATRLFVHWLSVSLVMWGCLAIASQPASFRELRGMTPLPDIGWSGVFFAIGCAAILWLERRTVELLTNFYGLDTPSKRLRIWMLRMPMPLLAITAVAAIGGNLAGCIAALSVLVVTLIENLSHYPRQHFETLGNPFLREAAAALPVVAILLVGASVYAFGLPGAGLPTAVLIDRGVKIKSDLAIRMQLTERIDPKLRREGPRPGEPVQPLELRWSRDRGKKDAGVKVRPSNAD